MDPKIKITRVEAGQDANASVFVVIDNAVIGSVLSLEGPVDNPVFIIQEDGSAIIAKNIDVLEERMELKLEISTVPGSASIPVFATFNNNDTLIAAADVYIFPQDADESNIINAFPSFITSDEKINCSFYTVSQDEVEFNINNKTFSVQANSSGIASISLPSNMVFSRDIFNLKTISKLQVSAKSKSGKSGTTFVHAVPKSIMALAAIDDVNRPSCVIIDPSATAAFTIASSSYPQKCFSEPVISHALTTTGSESYPLEFYSEGWDNCDNAYATKMEDFISATCRIGDKYSVSSIKNSFYVIDESLGSTNVDGDWAAVWSACDPSPTAPDSAFDPCIVAGNVLAKIPRIYLATGQNAVSVDVIQSARMAIKKSPSYYHSVFLQNSAIGKVASIVVRLSNGNQVAKTIPVVYDVRSTLMSLKGDLENDQDIIEANITVSLNGSGSSLRLDLGSDERFSIRSGNITGDNLENCLRVTLNSNYIVEGEITHPDNLATGVSGTKYVLMLDGPFRGVVFPASISGSSLVLDACPRVNTLGSFRVDQDYACVNIALLKDSSRAIASPSIYKLPYIYDENGIPVPASSPHVNEDGSIVCSGVEGANTYIYYHNGTNTSQPWIRITDKSFEYPKIAKDISSGDECVVCETPVSQETQLHACYIGPNTTPRVHSHISSLWNKLSGSSEWSRYFSSINVDSYNPIVSVTGATIIDRDQIITLSKGAFANQQVIVVYESLRSAVAASSSSTFSSTFESGTANLYPVAPSAFASGKNMASVLVQFDSSSVQAYSVNINFNGRISKIFASNTDLERLDSILGITGILGSSSADTGIFPLADSTARVSSYAISVGNNLRSVNINLGARGSGLCRIRFLIEPDSYVSRTPDNWVRISSGDALVSVPSAENAIMQMTPDGSECAAVTRLYKDEDGVYFDGMFDQINYGVDCNVNLEDITFFQSESTVIDALSIDQVNEFEPAALAAAVSNGSGNATSTWRYAVEYIGKAKSSRTNLYPKNYRRSDNTPIFNATAPVLPGIRQGELCSVLLFDVHLTSLAGNPERVGSMTFNVPISFMDIRSDLMTASDAEYAVIQAPFTLSALNSRRAAQESYTNVNGQLSFVLSQDRKTITFKATKPTTGSVQFGFRIYLQSELGKTLSLKTDNDIQKEINSYLSSYTKSGNYYIKENNRLQLALSGKKYDACVPLVSACRYDDLTENPNAEIPVAIDQTGQLSFFDSDEDVLNVSDISSTAAPDIYNQSTPFRMGGKRSNLNKWSVVIMLEKETALLTNSESPSEYGERVFNNPNNVSLYVESTVFEVFSGRAKLALVCDPNPSKALDGSIGDARRIVSEGDPFAVEGGFRLSISSFTSKLPAEYSGMGKYRDRLAPNIDDSYFDYGNFSSAILCAVNGKPNVAAHIIHDDPSMRRQIDLAFGNPFGEHPIHEFNVQSPVSMRAGRRYQLDFDNIYVGNPLVRFTDEIRISNFDMDINSMFVQSPTISKYMQNGSFENSFADPGDFVHLEHGNQYLDSWTILGGGCCYSGSYLIPSNGLRSVILESNISSNFSLVPTSITYQNFTFTKSRRSRSSTGVGGAIGVSSTVPARSSVLDASLGMRRYPATDPSRFRTVMVSAGDQADSFRILSRHGEFTEGSRPDFKKIRFEFEGTGSPMDLQIHNLDTDLHKLMCFSHSNYSGNSPVDYTSDFTSTFYLINPSGTLVGVHLPSSLNGWGTNPSSIQVATNIANDVVKVSSKGSQSADNTGVGAFGVYLKKDGSIGQFGEHLAVTIEDPPTGFDFVDVAAGLNFAIALRRDGSLAAWGDDTDGVVSGLPSGLYVSVDCGAHFAVALRSDGEIVCWGDNSVNQCDSPAGIFVKIRCGWDCSSAIDRDGQAYCWGQDPVSGPWSVPSGIFRDVHVGGGPIKRIYPSDVQTATGSNSAVAGGTDGSNTHDPSVVHSGDIARYGVGITVAGDVVTWGDDSTLTVNDSDDANSLDNLLLLNEFIAMPNGDYVSIYCGAQGACLTNVDGGFFGFGSGSVPYSSGSPKFLSYYGNEFCVHKGGPVVDYVSAAPVYSLFDENESPPRWAQLNFVDENEWKLTRGIYAGRGASSLPITVSGDGVNRNFSLCERNNRIHISFESTRNKENCICYSSSYPEISRFTDIVKITSGAKDRNSPSIAVDDYDNKMIAWSEKRNSNQSIVCATSINPENTRPDSCFIDACTLAVNRFSNGDPYYVAGLQECEIVETFYFTSTASDIYFDVEFYSDMAMQNRIAIYSSLDIPDNFSLDGEHILSDGVSVSPSQSYQVKFFAPNDPLLMGNPLWYKFKAKSFAIDFGQSDILSDYLILKSTGTIVDGTADDFATYTPQESSGSFYVIFEGVQRYNFDVTSYDQLQFNAYANAPSRDSGIFLPPNYNKLPGVKSQVRTMSHLMHIVNDSADYENGVQYTGKVTFTSPICGIIFKGTDLEKTDGIASGNAFYPPTADRDTVFSPGSKIVISPDGSTIQINFVAKDPGLRDIAVQQIRILTIETDSVQDEKTGVFGCDKIRNVPCGVQFKFNNDIGANIAAYGNVQFRAIIYSSSDVDDVVAIFTSVTHPHMWRYGDEQFPSSGSLIYKNDSLAIGFYPDFVDPSSAISSFDSSDAIVRNLTNNDAYYDIVRESIFYNILYRIRIDAIYTAIDGATEVTLYKDKIHEQQILCNNTGIYRLTPDEWKSSGSGKFDTVISESNTSGAVDVVAARNTFYIGFEKYADPDNNGRSPSCPDILLAAWDATEDRFDSSAQGGKDRIINIGFESSVLEMEKYRVPKIIVDELSNFSVFALNQNAQGSAIGISNGSIGYQRVPEILQNVEDLRACAFNDSVGERFAVGEPPSSYMKVRIASEDIFSFTPSQSGDPYPVVISPFVNLDIIGVPGTYAIRVRNDDDAEFSPWVPVGGDVPVLPLNVADENDYRAFQNVFRARFVSRDRILMPWLLSSGSGFKTVCIEVLTFFGKTVEFCTQVICEPTMPSYNISYYAQASLSASGSSDPEVKRTLLTKYKQYPVVGPFIFNSDSASDVNEISEDDLRSIYNNSRIGVEDIYFEVSFDNYNFIDKVVQLASLSFFKKRTLGRSPVVSTLIYRGIERVDLDLTQHATEKNTFYGYLPFKRADGILRKDGLALMRISIPLLGIYNEYINFLRQIQELKGQIPNKSSSSIQGGSNALIPPIDESVAARAYGNSEYYR